MFSIHIDPPSPSPSPQNWVVSKFGRVLPVLQLSLQKGVKVRSVKYDPSKYSHNIHRLDQWSQESATPVTHLTWQLQGGDSDISRKRRGEFPAFHPAGPKRSRADKSSDGGGDQAKRRWRKASDTNPLYWNSRSRRCSICSHINNLWATDRTKRWQMRRTLSRTETTLKKSDVTTRSDPVVPVCRRKVTRF